MTVVSVVKAKKDAGTNSITMKEVLVTTKEKKVSKKEKVKHLLQFASKVQLLP